MPLADGMSYAVPGPSYAGTPVFRAPSMVNGKKETPPVAMQDGEIDGARVARATPYQLTIAKLLQWIA